MTNESKKYHSYTDTEILNADGSSQDLDNVNQYYVLNMDWAYAHGCGREGAGVIAFENMLNALLFHLYHLDSLGRKHLEEKEYLELNSELEESIQKIKMTKSDKDMDWSYSGFDANNVGCRIISVGYWDDFVPSALEEFIDDLNYTITDCIDCENDESKLKDLRSQIKDLEILKKQSNITNSKFIHNFFGTCADYEERHC